VFPVGWCLHNILLSCFSTEEIGLSSKLVPTIFAIVGWCLQTFKNLIFLSFSLARVSTLTYVHCDLSLYVLMNG
jgi:hypothetical protein